MGVVCLARKFALNKFDMLLSSGSSNGTPKAVLLYDIMKFNNTGQNGFVT